MLVLLVMSARMLARYQATQVDANLADTGMPCAGIDGNPFHDITGLASERDIPSNATFSRPSNLPIASGSYPEAHLSLYDALKAHMHSKHKLVSHAYRTTGFYSYYEGLQLTKTLAMLSGQRSIHPSR